MLDWISPAIRGHIAMFLIFLVAWALGRDLIAQIPGLSGMNEINPMSAVGASVIIWITTFLISAAWTSGKGLRQQPQTPDEIMARAAVDIAIEQVRKAKNKPSGPPPTMQQ